MSSFFAHSLIAVSIYENKKYKSKKIIRNLYWLIWLIIIASFPDLDYIVPALHSSNNNGLRITHSILFSLIPSVVIFIIFSFSKIKYKIYLVQTILAGLSHLLLDLLVGVTPLPLLFPFGNRQFRLPFGVLPSAGKISLNNYYFYRNLYLEMGVLLPLLLAIHLIRYKSLNFFLKILSILILFIFSGYFIHQCYLLPR